MIMDKDYLSSLYYRDGMKRLKAIENMINESEQFLAKSGYPKSVNKVRKTLQIDKDETILTLYTFACLQKGGTKIWEKLLKQLFPQWQEPILEANIQLEYAVSPSREVMDSINGFNNKFPHPIKYVHEISKLKSNLEGPTTFDAVLTVNSKIKVFFECKFTSDISHQTTHNLYRNQIARCIDLGLSEVGDDVEKMYFVLVTPETFKEFPGSRLYYFKMNQYKNDIMTLALDIPRINEWFEHPKLESDLKHLSNHIGWLSWEECYTEICNSPILDAKTKHKLQQFYTERMLNKDTEDLPF